MKKYLLIFVAMCGMASMATAQSHIEYKWRGFYSVVDYSYMFNLTRATDTVSAHMLGFSAGFQFRKETAVGGGVYYVADPTGAFTQLPIFVELRSHFMRSQLTPYTVLQAGYSLAVGSSSQEAPYIKIDEGGLYFSFEVGARYAIDRSFAVGAHLGYKLLQSNTVTRSDINHNPLKADAVVLHAMNVGVCLYF